MAKKFEVSFFPSTTLSPSVVYVSSSDGYPNHFLVGILYQASSTGTFNSADGIVRNFDFNQNLFGSEQEAINWAKTWLAEKSGCTVSLKEATIFNQTHQSN